MKFVVYSIVAVLAVVASVIAFRLSDTPEPAPVVQATQVKEINVKTVDVLVARVNIPVGTIIDNTMIDKQPWPENLVLEGFVINDGYSQDNIVGKVVRSAIQAHEPFMKSKLANPNDPGFLAANLPAGMRAITIATDVISGVAGFVFPGDRVDLLFTHDPVTGEASSAGKPEFTEVMASRILVLAVNLRDSSDATKSGPVVPSSITIAVDEHLAQKVRLAEKIGTLSFALRSIRDDVPTVVPPTGLADLSSASDRPMSVVYGPRKAGGKVEVIPTNISSGAGDNSATVGIVRGGSGDSTTSTVPPTSPASSNEAVSNQNIGR